MQLDPVLEGILTQLGQPFKESSFTPFYFPFEECLELFKRALILFMILIFTMAMNTFRWICCRFLV
jgi:hypothetical protein